MNKIMEEGRGGRRTGWMEEGRSKSQRRNDGKGDEMEEVKVQGEN